MQSLTPLGQQTVAELAQRYGCSLDAVSTLLNAVAAGNGTMAQFSHPELGGAGQWMQGGMTMVGDMFNYALKGKVDGLCSELSRCLSGPPLWEPPPLVQPQGGVSVFVGSGSGNWWPGELGAPSSSGAQNNIRYAVFPAARRLALDIGGQVTVYDTLDHQIGGVSQQQGWGSSLTFTSQYGLVRLDDLPVVLGNSLVASAPQPAAMNPPPPEPVVSASGDVFAAIERLADLRQKGILTDEEFSKKKAELLARV